MNASGFNSLFSEFDLNADMQDNYAITSDEYASLQEAWHRLSDHAPSYRLGAGHSHRLNEGRLPLGRGDGVEIVSSDRDTVTVSGLGAADIGRLALDRGVALRSLVPEQRSLEDVFMSLTADAVQYHGSSTAIATESIAA